MTRTEGQGRGRRHGWQIRGHLVKGADLQEDNQRDLTDHCQQQSSQYGSKWGDKLCMEKTPTNCRKGHNQNVALKGKLCLPELSS